jgi:general stress protein YciG
MFAREIGRKWLTIADASKLESSRIGLHGSSKFERSSQSGHRKPQQDEREEVQEMTNDKSETPAPKRARGFAGMDPSKQRAISSRGGKAAHAKGKAHEFSTEEAREAGRRGGLITSSDREHMAEIGRKGGSSRGVRRRERKAAEAESGRAGLGDQPTVLSLASGCRR